MFFAMGITHLVCHLYLGPYGCRTTMDACSLAIRSQVRGCVPQSLMEDVYILRIVLIACLNHIYISLYVVSSKTTSVLFPCISHTQDCDIHVSQFGTRGWAAAALIPASPKPVKNVESCGNGLVLTCMEVGGGDRGQFKEVMWEWLSRHGASEFNRQ